MFGILLLLFIGIPLIDLFLLVRIGRDLGLWPTVAAVVLTGFAGAALVRWQGLRTLGRVNFELNAGRMPGTELADGAMILLAAALLLTPGFLTDVVALALLLPVVRRLLRGLLVRFLKHRIHMTRVEISAVVRDAATDLHGNGPVFFPGSTVAPGMKYVRNQAGDGAPSTNTLEDERAQD